MCTHDWILSLYQGSNKNTLWWLQNFDPRTHIMIHYQIGFIVNVGKVSVLWFLYNICNNWIMINVHWNNKVDWWVVLVWCVPLKGLKLWDFSTKKNLTSSLPQFEWFMSPIRKLATRDRVQLSCNVEKERHVRPISSKIKSSKNQNLTENWSLNRNSSEKAPGIGACR